MVDRSGGIGLMFLCMLLMLMLMLLTPMQLLMMMVDTQDDYLRNCLISVSYFGDPNFWTRGPTST
jgi:hypothetical protein